MLLWYILVLISSHSSIGCEIGPEIGPQLANGWTVCCKRTKSCYHDCRVVLDTQTEPKAYLKEILARMQWSVLKLR